MRGLKPHHVVLLALLSASGCQSALSTMGQMGVPGFTRFALDKTEGKNAEEMRLAYQTDGDPQAIRWLLKNVIRTGMERKDVENALGEKGERVWADAPYKKNDPKLLQDDQTYRWGPDSRGNVHVLFFRKDKLIHFDPEKVEE